MIRIQVNCDACGVDMRAQSFPSAGKLYRKVTHAGSDVCSKACEIALRAWWAAEDALAEAKNGDAI